MKTKSNYYILSLMSGMLSVVACILFIFKYSSDDKLYTFLIPIMLSIATLSFLLIVIRTFKKNDKSLTIALLGFPQIGKTVYLTVLFNELQKNKNNRINFLPYGNETVEKVSKDITMLQLGEWLPKTETNQFFYYRATTTIGDLFKRNYKLEIGDFAGERYEDLLNINFNWIHRDKYFDYAIQSDIIFIAISAEIFRKYEEKVEVINSTIASINILAQKKGYSDFQKMKEPICLLILKSDILKIENIKEEESYLNMIDDLLVVCRKRSNYFKSFFVSSTGKTIDNKPSRQLKPSNVIEPLLWVLNKE